MPSNLPVSPVTQVHQDIVPIIRRLSTTQSSLSMISGVLLILSIIPLTFVSQKLSSINEGGYTWPISLLLSLALLLYGVKLILESIRSQFAFMPNAVIHQGAFFTRTLNLNEIEGYTISHTNDPAAIVIWPKTTPRYAGSNRATKLRLYITPDPAIKSWLSKLKNLNEKEINSGIFIYSDFDMPQAVINRQKKNAFLRIFPVIRPFIVISIFYSFVAASNTVLLNWTNALLSPPTKALEYIGLGISKPFMEGKLPVLIYTNIVSIYLWGCIVFGLRTAWHCMTNDAWKRRLVEFQFTRLRRFTVRHGGGQLGVRLGSIVLALAGFYFSLKFLHLILLNGTQGLLAIEVDSYLLLPIWPLLYILFPAILTLTILTTLIVGTYLHFVAIKKLVFRKTIY